MYRFGLAGYPVAHSRSPEIFKAIFKISGTTGTYELFPIPEKEAFVEFVKNELQHLDGLNVTIPYKELAATLAEVKDSSVETSGAANLLFVKNNNIYGYNTDIYGFIKSLGGFRPATAAVIGTGGAARAVVVALDMLGTEKVYIHSRSPDKLEKFVQSLTPAVETLLINAFDLREEIDLVVNASPAGMHPNIDELPEGWELIKSLRRGGMAYDLIYNPARTKFLRAAEQLPIKTMNGLRMLVLQAAAAFEIVTGNRVDEQRLIQEIGAE